MNNENNATGNSDVKGRNLQVLHSATSLRRHSSPTLLGRFMSLRCFASFVSCSSYRRNPKAENKNYNGPGK
eukprot:1638431-Amphidinium_carterae.1